MRSYIFLPLVLVFLAAGSAALGAQTFYSSCQEPGTAIGPDAGSVEYVEFEVADETILTGVMAGLNVSHSYSYDLVISLESPAGTTVTIMNHEGEDFSDVQTYGISATFSDYGYDGGFYHYVPFSCGCLLTPGGPGAFSDYFGEVAAGTWRFRFADDENLDGGTINAVCLYLDNLRDPDAEACASPGTSFGSTQESITSSVTIDQDLIITDLEVFTDISHSWVSDIGLSITDPSGATATMLTTYSVDLDFPENIFAYWCDGGIDIPGSLNCHCFVKPGDGFAAFYDAPAKGDWSLNVVDANPGYADGVLNSWCLRIFGEPVVYSAQFSSPAVSFGTYGYPDGVADSIDFSSDANEIVDGVGVYTDLSHTYISEVGVILKSPSGTEVTLFDHDESIDGLLYGVFFDFGRVVSDSRFGCGCHLAPTGPGTLSDFSGETQEGDWELSVSDSDQQFDDGYMDTWGIYFYEQADLYACNSPGFKFGFSEESDYINIAETGIAKEVEVSTEVTHPFIGYVQLTLTSPSGDTVYLLVADDSNDIENLRILWSDHGTEYNPTFILNFSGWDPMKPYDSLSLFDGQSITGDWTLSCKTSDFFAGGGTLDRWCLRLQVDDGPQFKRGDVNGNGTTSGLQDTLYLLSYAFTGGAAPPCMKSADVDGNNSVSGLNDALKLLAWAFVGGAAPPAPGPFACGQDNDPDQLTCDTPPECH